MFDRREAGLAWVFSLLVLAASLALITGSLMFLALAPLALLVLVRV